MVGILLGGGNSSIFYFHPEPWGFMIQFDEHIFEMGWNHHLYFLVERKNVVIATHPLANTWVTSATMYRSWLKFLPWNGVKLRLQHNLQTGYLLRSLPCPSWFLQGFFVGELVPSEKLGHNFLLLNWKKRVIEVSWRVFAWFVTVPVAFN